jgi:hypothetical protein
MKPCHLIKKKTERIFHGFNKEKIESWQHRLPTPVHEREKGGRKGKFIPHMQKRIEGENGETQKEWSGTGKTIGFG